ncbi:hypothetical protein DF182_02045 [Chitinophaga flava]|uniref:Uncharacterized protein n=2 Tax=Chitinophaga flava TaxID=2259036 RepID=A0A365Y0Q9_9BACT|nr:hypothetical protein DF182_02045 [Chitinophaga flava]
MKQMTWGLTGDKQVSVISNSDSANFIPQRSREYVYEGLSDIYYKLQHDTLFIYTPTIAPVPQYFRTPYKVIQIKLSNPEAIDLFVNHEYKKKGLTKIGPE